MLGKQKLDDKTFLKFEIAGMILTVYFCDQSAKVAVKSLFLA